MSTVQFLSSLPAILGITGFVVYHFLLKEREGNRVTVDIVAKLRQSVPEVFPQGTNLDPASLAKLIDSNAAVKAKISNQDFRLLQDALRHQFISSIVVYSISAFLFVVGAVLFTYLGTQPVPLAIDSISAHSTDENAQGQAVDLDNLRVKWVATGQPQDIQVSIEEMDSHIRSSEKNVRSTEGQIEFAPSDLRSILRVREFKKSNRLRVVMQGKDRSFLSDDFEMAVGAKIICVLIEPLRVKFAATVDNVALDNFSFEAKLVGWARSPGKEPEPVTIGGKIDNQRSDFLLDPNLQYDWSAAKLVYFGPHDQRIVRTELIGF